MRKSRFKGIYNAKYDICYKEHNSIIYYNYIWKGFYKKSNHSELREKFIDSMLTDIYCVKTLKSYEQK
jgi:hypothetical protein